jgi:hypothetical protein
MYAWPATGMTALAVAGFIAYAAGAGDATIGLIAGVGSGVARDLSVVWGLNRARVSSAATAAGRQGV